MNRQRVLVVEDEKKTAASLQLYLTSGSDGLHEKFTSLRRFAV